jgi:hypothetical protein
MLVFVKEEKTASEVTDDLGSTSTKSSLQPVNKTTSRVIAGINNLKSVLFFILNSIF